MLSTPEIEATVGRLYLAIEDQRKTIAEQQAQIEKLKAPASTQTTTVFPLHVVSEESRANG